MGLHVLVEQDLERQCPNVEVHHRRKWGHPDEEKRGTLHVVVWVSQHEGNLMKLAGCPLVEVQ